MGEETQLNIPPSRASREGLQELAIELIKYCGYGRMLVVGLQDPELICELLRHGVDVIGFAASSDVFSKADALVPGRVQGTESAISRYLSHNRVFDTAVILAGSDALGDLGGSDCLLARLIESSRSVMLAFLDGLESPEAICRWDKKLASSGARRHPLALSMAPYGSLDVLVGKTLLLYECTSRGARSIVLPSGLDASKIHGIGPEEEAHAARYELAARFVRSGDSALDIASVGGSGAYLLSKSTDASIVAWNTDPHFVKYLGACFSTTGTADLVFKQTPRGGLKSLGSESIDFIVADGDPIAFGSQWGEVTRTLTPGGRLYLCCPVKEYADKDLASHLHAKLESSGLLLERCWLQSTQPRQPSDRNGLRIQELLPESIVPCIGDWVLLLAMKPITAYEFGVGDIVRNSNSPNVIAFTRDYENPWLVRGLVATGLRATSVMVRTRMAENVLATAPVNSADYGAALCVRCYSELENGSEADVLNKWLQRALAFSATPTQNPTSVRWQISLLYVAGLIAMRTGDLVLAESTFSRIDDFDALKFSPLLGTKTVGAALRSGLIAFARGDKDCAKQRWTRAVLETQRLLRDGEWREVIVDINRPETFGLPELAAFVMEGARAAGGLRALHDFPDKPFLVWQALHGTQADVLQMQDLELRSLRRWYSDHDRRRDSWIKELEDAKGWLAQQSASWEAAARLKDEQLQSLTDQYARLDEGKGWLEQQLRSWEAAARSKDEQIQSLTDQYARLDEGKGWLEQQLTSWEAAARLKDEQLQSLTDQYARLDEGKGWLERQLRSWEAAARSKDEQIQSLTDQYARLDEGKGWLEQQLRSWEAAARSKDEQIQSLTDQYARLDEGKGWLEQQLRSWEAAARSKDEQIQSLTDQYARLDEGKAWLEQQLISWKVVAESKERAVEELVGKLAGLHSSLESVERRLDDARAALVTSEQHGEAVALYNTQLQQQRLQLEQRIEAMHGEIIVLAKIAAADSLRLKLIESSRLFRLGRKFGLIRDME